MFVQEGEEGLGRDIQENWKFIVGQRLGHGVVLDPISNSNS